MTKVVKALLIANCMAINLEGNKDLADNLAKLVHDAGVNDIPVFIANAVEDGHPDESRIPFKTFGASEYQTDLLNNKLSDELIAELKTIVSKTINGVVLLAGTSLLPHMFELTFNEIGLCFVATCCESKTSDGIDGDVFQMYFDHHTVYVDDVAIFDDGSEILIN